MHKQAFIAATLLILASCGGGPDDGQMENVGPLTEAETVILANLDRQIDSGEVPFVMLDGTRVAVTPRAMKHFALAPSQTIDDEQFAALLRFNIDDTLRQIAERDEAPRRVR